MVRASKRSRAAAGWRRVAQEAEQRGTDRMPAFAALTTEGRDHKADIKTLEGFDWNPRFGFWNEPDGVDCCILALCFIAAMVETGDLT